MRPRAASDGPAAQPMPDQDDTISRLLLAWWDSGHADLPWRQTRDPYAIWVAEVMLQQTQIATVIPYYIRWMARFPTGRELAAAPLDEVLKQWQGLGYYAAPATCTPPPRRSLTSTAAICRAPPPQLRKLPGIGRYTAGAIASIAYRRACAVLDGNVIRVLSRLFDLTDDVTLSATKNQLWATRWSTPVPPTVPVTTTRRSWNWVNWSARPPIPDCAALPAARSMPGPAARHPVRTAGAPAAQTHAAL